MKDNFTKALNFTLKWEGYISDSPHDPGGLTIFGISKRHWPKEVEEMRKLDRDKALLIAQSIYKKAYWDASGCDDLSASMDIVVFDTSVNCGVGRTKEWHKESVSWEDLIMRRLKHYAMLNNPTFLKGWVNRVLALYDEVRVGGISVP